MGRAVACAIKSFSGLEWNNVHQSAAMSPPAEKCCVSPPVVLALVVAGAVKLRLKWDGDQFTPTDVVNLLSRAGQQVGIQEGRPDSKNSAGMGWGTFEVVS